MIKFKTLKELPGVPVGTIVEQDWYDLYHFGDRHFEVEYLRKHPDFFEEIQEPKTIFDLKAWDGYYVLNVFNKICEYSFQGVETIKEVCTFLTEKEARRNKLLRKLATRTDKWLPEKWDLYYSIDTETNWYSELSEIALYHMGIIFRSEKEYRKWISEDEEKLLTEL